MMSAKANGCAFLGFVHGPHGKNARVLFSTLGLFKSAEDGTENYLEILLWEIIAAYPNRLSWDVCIPA